MSDDTTNQDFGKVLVHGHKEFYITNTEISIFDNDTYIGKINRNELFQYKVNKDTTLIFKSGPRKAEVKVRFDVNNEIFLSYNSNIVANIQYTNSNLNIDDIKIEKNHSKYKKKLAFKKRKSIGTKGLICLMLTLLFGYLFFKDYNFIYLIISFFSLMFFFTCFIESSGYKKANGPKLPTIQENQYENKVNKILIPLLNQNGFTIPAHSYGNSSSELTYLGKDLYSNDLKLTFYITHSGMTNENNYKNPMYLVMKYKYCDVTIGEIDLSTNENITNTSNLILSNIKEIDFDRGLIKEKLLPTLNSKGFKTLFSISYNKGYQEVTLQDFDEIMVYFKFYKSHKNMTTNNYEIPIYVTYHYNNTSELDIGTIDLSNINNGVELIISTIKNIKSKYSNNELDFVKDEGGV